MRTLFVSIIVVQIIAYLALGWLHFFSRQHAHIPVSYIALHLVAGLNFLFLVIGLWSLFAQGTASSARLYLILLSLPPILLVGVLYVIKMVHRWL